MFYEMYVLWCFLLSINGLHVAHFTILLFFVKELQSSRFNYVKCCLLDRYSCTLNNNISFASELHILFTHIKVSYEIKNYSLPLVIQFFKYSQT